MWLCINLMVVKVMRGRCQGDKLGCYGDRLCGSQGDVSESLRVVMSRVLVTGPGLSVWSVCLSCVVCL